MKTGLVMEGGAMRGMFTAAVIDALMAEGITFDGAIGVSAGAGFGCNIKSRQPGRVIRYSKRFARNWRYASWRSFFLTGNLFGAKFLYDTVPYHLDPFDLAAYRANPLRFYCVVTDCATGRPVIHELASADPTDMKWLRASASMPVVSRPVAIDGSRYLDGGISDSIPLKAFQNMGYARNVVVLTQPAGYRKEPQDHPRLLRFALRGIPRVYEDLMERHAAYNAEVAYVAEAERQGTAFVIRPRTALHIPSVCHDPAELQRVYDEGVAVMAERMPALREWMKL